MPFSVSLSFVPPAEEDITKLRVWESSTKAGSFAMVEETTAVGEFPDYIDHFTTEQALSLTDWFAISWVDSRGAETPLSTPIQTGNVTLIWEVIKRARIIDSDASENELVGPAAAAIERYLAVVDPFAPVASDYTYNQREGLALLTLARSRMANAIRYATSQGFQAGLVSLKAGVALDDIEKALQAMLDLADYYLGIEVSSWVFQMQEVDILPTENITVQQLDISRLLGVVIR